MKDLYTFDSTPEQAHQTYLEVSEAYANFFDDLKLPVLVAKADSGDMGGNLSHEYHLPSVVGEDIVFSCCDCDYTANEEVVEKGSDETSQTLSGSDISRRRANPVVMTWFGLSRDKTTLVEVQYPLLAATTEPATQETGDIKSQINTRALKRAVPELDLGIEEPVKTWKEHLLARHQSTATAPAEQTTFRLIRIHDHRIPAGTSQTMVRSTSEVVRNILNDIPNISIESVEKDDKGNPIDLSPIMEGSSCPKCSSGILKIQKAIEIGHTFHLGTRYSLPLKARVAADPKHQHSISLISDERNPIQHNSQKQLIVPAQMGCHGIGVSRLIGAIAEAMSDDKGLNWPRAAVPFDVAIFARSDCQESIEQIYDILVGKDSDSGNISVSGQSKPHFLKAPTFDVVIDDRIRALGKKSRDAELVGIPLTVVLAQSFKEHGTCEVKFRRKGAETAFVPIHELRAHIQGYLENL
jgi:prolyl-tRNA synthetase